MTFAALGETLRAIAAAKRQRRLVVLTGSRHKGLDAARQLADEDPLLLASSGTEGALNDQAVRNLLGTEIGSVVVDAHDAVNPDALGIISGAVRAGHLMCVLLPSTEDIPGIESAYRRRLCVQLLREPDATVVNLVEDADAIPLPLEDPSTSLCTGSDMQPDQPATDCQRRAVEAVVHIVEGQRRKPVALTADRGRGKTAALGIAAGQLLQRSNEPIIVTSARRMGFDTLLRHAKAVHADADLNLLWQSPEQLVDTTAPCQLLMIDEAAGLPMATLEQLLRRYSRVALATTVHGYEGSGRGFLLRFLPTLERLSRGARTIHLEQPVRWSTGDPVEGAFNRLLVLDAELREPEVESNSEWHISLIEPALLLNNESLLREIFSLLVLAHHKTRPRDLQQLLDNPAQQLMLARSGENGPILGLIQLNREGGFDSATSTAIAGGNRRPPGHMLVELLAGQSSGKVAALNILRIVRIVVHPSFRRRGIGRALLASLKHQSTDVDLVGASLALSPALIRFWRECGFQLIQIGRRPTVQSGSHSGTMIKPFSDRARQIVSPLRDTFLRNLPFRLETTLRQLETESIQALLLNNPDLLAAPDAEVIADVRGVALNRYAADDVPYSAKRSTMHGIATGGFPSPRLMIERILQGRDWKDSGELEGDTGWREGNREIATMFAAYLQHHGWIDATSADASE